MNDNCLYTERLLLRPWQISDAESLYKYASDPLVGPIAGFPVHSSVENSTEVITHVLSEPETYAVCLRDDGIAMGSIGLLRGDKSNLETAKDEAELGYWIGVPFWGKGYIPEAARELIRHAFEDMGLNALWCGYFDGNVKSKRVQEKCGFSYQHTLTNIYWPLMNDIRTEHITKLLKEDWQKIRKY